VTDVVDAQAEVLGWGVVANVVDERVVGADLDIRRGLKHFVPGAKVWVSEVWNGDGGERRWVVGRHRRSHRYVRMIVAARHLRDPRVKGVYSPDLARRLEHRLLFETREYAEQVAAGTAWWSSHLEASFDIAPTYGGVTDPPPLELVRDGTTFYLAHFNHRRARYSALPPPVEP
jgi:hypothetical protein